MFSKIHIMKRPTLKSKMRRELLLVSLSTLALIGFAWYSVQCAEADITPRLIGEWKVQSSREDWMARQDLSYPYSKPTDLTSYYLFKSDGTYEWMIWKNAMLKSSSRTVEKGKYQISGSQITLRDFKQFSRPNRRDEGLDVDATSTPCSNSIGCASEWEAHDAYIQMAKEGVSFQIVRANWDENYFVTHPIIEQDDGSMQSQQASWIKEPEAK